MQNDQPPQESVPRSVPPQDPIPIPESGLLAWIVVGIQYSPDDLRKYFLCDGKAWHSGKLNIEFHCNHPMLKNNWKKWMRATNPTWNGKSTQVRKSFVFFAALELHGIKIDWSTMNVHKGINRYSAEEKKKARKELWRMQVKFEGELCEPIDPIRGRGVELWAAKLQTNIAANQRTWSQGEGLNILRWLLVDRMV
ncbi:hypothetical protein R1flu_022128 [Riccia fluitans]|uniref:Uncharacterized protein n=1 Tax=Riccia fluitans TaxID=41844 RepID=A0ABD1ZRB6_9MARC